jgi:hypothetical protein
MSKTSASAIAWVIGMCLFGAMAMAFGEDTLAAAKDLYGAAAYQDALSMLDRLKAAGPPAEAAQEIDKYRAFCLFAIGNTHDAEQAVADIVVAWPRFRLGEGEAVRGAQPVMYLKRIEIEAKQPGPDAAP